VLHPADVVPVVLAWLAVLSVCVAACLFGQTARTARRSSHGRSAAGRVGLFLSLSGPWLVVLVAAGAGAATGAWLPAAAVGACSVVAASMAGLSLAPH
jgi:hypothetical protein